MKEKNKLIAHSVWKLITRIIEICTVFLPFFDEKIFSCCEENFKNGSWGSLKWARGSLKMGKRANFEITNEVSDFKGPECPFWDSRVPIWDSRVNLFEIFEQQEEIWALNKGKNKRTYCFFQFMVFFCVI